VNAKRGQSRLLEKNMLDAMRRITLKNVRRIFLRTDMALTQAWMILYEDARFCITFQEQYFTGKICHLCAAY
jgi:hypothetical protein